MKKIFGGIKYQLTHHKNPEKPHIGLVGSLEANKKISCWPIDHSAQKGQKDCEGKAQLPNLYAVCFGPILRHYYTSPSHSTFKVK